MRSVFRSVRTKFWKMFTLIDRYSSSIWLVLSWMDSQTDKEMICILRRCVWTKTGWMKEDEQLFSSLMIMRCEYIILI